MPRRDHKTRKTEGMAAILEKSGVESLPRCDLGVARKVSFDLQQSVAEADIVAAATVCHQSKAA